MEKLKKDLAVVKDDIKDILFSAYNNVTVFVANTIDTLECYYSIVVKKLFRNDKLDIPKFLQGPRDSPYRIKA